ncbi:hypothetical protein [Lysobacter claricitrinus]|uniref:hypothetical protein n=1 Tax=Lysobacter claricitrinus TaxID=3367728 RepID=UPI0037DAB777
MTSDPPGMDAADPGQQGLDDIQWHCATNEGWRHPPECAAPLPAPPARVAPRAALAVPGRVVDMATWRERRGDRQGARGAQASP